MRRRSCPRERRRLEGWLRDAGITDAPGPWVAGVEDATLAAIERLGSGTAAELTKVVPELAIQIPIAIGKDYEGTVGVSTRVLFLLAMDGRISRGRPRGSWVSSQYRWEPMHRWVDMDGTVRRPTPRHRRRPRSWSAGSVPTAPARPTTCAGGRAGRSAPSGGALAALDTVEVDPG